MPLPKGMVLKARFEVWMAPFGREEYAQRLGTFKCESAATGDITDQIEERVTAGNHSDQDTYWVRKVFQGVQEYAS